MNPETPTSQLEHSAALIATHAPASIRFVDTIPEPPTAPLKPKPFDFMSLERQVMYRATPALLRTRRARLAKDRGRDIIDVFIGKILPGPFHDYVISYLDFAKQGELEIEYQIICQEAALPQQGAFRFVVSFEADRLQPYIRDVWVTAEDRDTDDHD